MLDSWCSAHLQAVDKRIHSEHLLILKQYRVQRLLEIQKMEGMSGIMITPVLLVYPFFQKYFAKGITMGAVKG